MQIKSILAAAAIALAASVGSAFAADQFATLDGIAADALTPQEMGVVTGAAAGDLTLAVPGAVAGAATGTVADGVTDVPTNSRTQGLGAGNVVTFN